MSVPRFTHSAEHSTSGSWGRRKPHRVGVGERDRKTERAKERETPIETEGLL